VADIERDVRQAVDADLVFGESGALVSATPHVTTLPAIELTTV
jgi:hypothetical protein